MLLGPSEQFIVFHSSDHAYKTFAFFDDFDFYSQKYFTYQIRYTLTPQVF